MNYFGEDQKCLCLLLKNLDALQILEGLIKGNEGSSVLSF